MDQDQRNRFRHLLILDDAEGRRTISLEAATYSIGRDTTNSIVVRSKLVSRQHAILLRVTSPDSSTYLFRIIDGDLQGKRSTNGLMINGRRLFSHDLKHGDMLVLGGDVQAKYYALSNLTDDDFDKFREAKDLSTILSNSINPFQTLVPTDDDFQDLSEAALVRLASFPELTPTPILEIDLSGVVTYLNPSAVMLFPDISDAGLKHPMLQGLLPMAKPSQPGHRSFLCGKSNWAIASSNSPSTTLRKAIWYGVTFQTLQNANAPKSNSDTKPSGKPSSTGLSRPCAALW